MRKEKQERKYTPDQLLVLNDLTIDRDVASIMTDLPIREISDYRFRIRYKDSIIRASKKFRDKRKLKDAERLGGRQYDYWTPADVEYIMTSTDSDAEMAEKLNRTVYSIQKKREREIKKGR